MGLVARSDMRSYLLVDGAYCEIGDGFTDFTENKNPREYSRQYIHESSERTDLIGFAPSVTYAFDVYDADAVQETLLEIMLSEAVGDAAYVCKSFVDGLSCNGSLVACVCVCTSFVKQVYRLVRETSVKYVSSAHIYGMPYRIFFITYAMIF